MNYPPIPPKSRYFRHKFGRDEFCIMENLEEDWCPIGEASDWAPYWLGIIAAVAAEEWRAESRTRWKTYAAAHDTTSCMRAAEADDAIKAWRAWGRQKSESEA